MVLIDLESKPPYPIYIWDLSSDHIRTIGNFSNLWLWHVDPDENILVAFEIDWYTDQLKVQQTKWTLTGRLLDKKNFHLSVPYPRLEVEGPF